MSKTSTSTAPFRPLWLGPYECQAEQRADGAWLLQSPEKLAASPPRYTDLLVRWATERPDTTFLAKRNAQGLWRQLTYGEASQQVEHIAQALLNRNLSAERPVMVLSENSLEHALISLAAMHVGIAVAPISPAYSLLSKTAERVRHAVDLLTPGLVFATDAARYAHAIETAVPRDTELVFLEGALAGRPCTRYDELVNTPVTEQVAQAHEAVGPGAVAKFLFTSGSTKLPKAVVNTHGMLTCNQQMFLQCYPFLAAEPPVLVDWMPWHHTGAGNHNFGLILYHGGTLYIDEGKPTSEGMAETIRNLKDVAPTIYYSVPKGLEMLAQAMKSDAALRDRFFSRLCNLFPQGAAMSAPLKHTLDELAIAACGMRIPMTASLGMTETAPFALSAHLPDWQAGIIGTPPPGLEVKLVQQGDKLEVRYRGPSIMPGYWRQPELTAEAFDEEGFLCSGDAARFVDDNAREQGLRYDGRIAEDFKLDSGTWVNVGALRQRVIAAGAPHIHDIVLTGHDRDELGMLIFLLPTASQLATHTLPSAGPAAIASDPGVRAWAQSLLDSLAKNATSSSQFIGRAMVLRDPPLMDLGEMTDKGSINQRSVLKTRAALVEQLYAPQPGSDTLLARRS